MADDHHGAVRHVEETVLVAGEKRIDAAFLPQFVQVGIAGELEELGIGVKQIIAAVNQKGDGKLSRSSGVRLLLLLVRAGTIAVGVSGRAVSPAGAAALSTSAKSSLSVLPAFGSAASSTVSAITGLSATASSRAGPSSFEACPRFSPS